MTCPGCGAWIPEDAGFCRGCGTIVRGPRMRQAGVSLPPVGAPRFGPAGYRPPDAATARYAPPPPSPVGYGIVPPPPPEGAPGDPPAAVLQTAPPPPPPGYGAAPSYPPLVPAVPAYAASAPPGYAPGQAMAPVYGYAPPFAAGRSDTVWARHPRARGIAIRHTGSDFLVAVFTAVSFVSLFLPWYEVRFADSVGDSINLGQTSALGTGAGGWRFAILATAVAVVGYLAARVALSRRWPPSVPHFPVLLLLALANLALIAIAFFQVPDGGQSVTDGGVTFGVTQAWGAYLGFGAAILAAVAAVANRPTIARTR